MSLMRSTLLMGFIVASLQALSQQTEPPARHEFSMQQCIDYAQKNSAIVKNVLLDVQIQEQQNRNITSAAFPQINGSFGMQYNPALGVQAIPDFISPAVYGVLVNEGVKDGNGNPIVAPTSYQSFQIAFGTKWSSNAGITLSQLLFDGQVFVGLQARKSSIDYRMQSAEVTKQQVRTNISKIYYQLSVSKVQVQLIDDNIKRAEKLKNDASELYKNGFAEQLDVDKASVQLTNLKSQRQTTINTISNGYLGLKMLMGMPIADTLILTDSISTDFIQAGSLTDGSYQYNDRPDYNALATYKKLQEYNVRRYKLSRMPTASLNAAYTKMAQTNGFDMFSSKAKWVTSSYIGLSINVPIFGGFAKDANIKMAKLQLDQANNNMDLLKLQIDQEVDSSITSFNNAIITMNEQQKNLDLATKVYDQTKKRYESGLASTTDISNAQADLSSAQNNYVIALYSAALAKVDYLKAIGKL